MTDEINIHYIVAAAYFSAGTIVGYCLAKLNSMHNTLRGLETKT